MLEENKKKSSEKKIENKIVETEGKTKLSANWQNIPLLPVFSKIRRMLPQLSLRCCVSAHTITLL